MFFDPLFSSVLLFLIIIATLMIIHYVRSAASMPELIYQDNPGNRRVLEAVRRLKQRYFATPWMYNAHLQLLWLGLKKAYAPRLVYDHSDTLTMPDGGTTALHWLGADLPSHTPTLVVLHTITGSPQSMRGFVRDLHALTGWRIVLCQRRGHGDLPLSSPRFNTMGDTHDLRRQLTLIELRYPESPLYAAAISAGTALLVRYLGEQGTDTPIRAAFALCPGYDISVAFHRSTPLYSRMMAKKLLRQFVIPNASSFVNLKSYDALIQACDLHEFHQHMYECAGFKSHEAFLSTSNPVAVMDNVSTPVLILNSVDDPVCVIDNVREHENGIRQSPNTILVVTKRGSHCAYFEGWSARQWAHQLAAEYLLVMHQNSNA